MRGWQRPSEDNHLHSYGLSDPVVAVELRAGPGPDSSGEDFITPDYVEISAFMPLSS